MTMSTELLSTNLVILFSVISLIGVAVIAVALVLLIKIHNNTKEPKN